jgi:predicted transglutaminase-like cysteine proteinase
MPYRATFPVRRPTLFNAPVAGGADPAVNAVASPDRPDVFNSVALPIARTPLDSRWNRVATAAVGGRAASFATALRGSDEQRRLEAVNAYVNGRVAFTNDSRQFGVADRWSSANETLARGRGDCEDYALAKLAMLRRAGFDDRDLYLVVLNDLARRADHAVLVVRSGGRFLVLDNGTNRLADSASLRDYRPVLTFTAGQRFTHGFRREAIAPVVLASYARDPQRPIVSGMPSSPFASR